MSDIVATVEYENTTTVTAVGIQGTSASDTKLESLQNVDTANLTQGSLLVYNLSSQKWVATRTLEEQNLEGGHF